MLLDATFVMVSSWIVSSLPLKADWARVWVSTATITATPRSILSGAAFVIDFTGFSASLPFLESFSEILFSSLIGVIFFR